MARIRSVKPEFWTDRSMGRLSRDARLLYIAMWNQADEHGRLNGDPRYVKGVCLPYDDDLDLEDVDRLLDELARAEKLVRYEAKDDPYLFLPNLGKHQRLETAKVPSRLPEPPPTGGGNPSGSRADKCARRADKSESNEDIHRDTAQSDSDDASSSQDTANAQIGADESARDADSSGTNVAQQVAGGRWQAAGSRAREPARTPPPLPPDVDRLKTRLAESRLAVRWDKLAADQLAEITDLIDRHGVERLAKAAAAAYQPNDPPAFAQAWLPGWRALPEPGAVVRAVAETCPVHQLEQPCRSCRADQLAGEA